jgi:hypothetical protein
MRLMHYNGEKHKEKDSEEQLVTSPMKDGYVVENACVQVDTYPNHMVHSVHEYRLLERGDENPWMDDPS